MSQVQLNFPLLVEPSRGPQPLYRLRPLLFPGLNAEHKRYANAVDLLRKAVRRRFRSFRLERDSLDELLWYCFDPQPRFELQPFELRVGKRWLSGRCAVAYYRLDGADYACFPMLDHATVMLQTADRDEQLFDTALRFFRDRQRRDGADFDPEQYFSAAAGSAAFNVSVEVRQARFPFQPAVDGWALLGGRQRLNGEEELARVGADLNDRYPDGLAEASCRAELAAAVGELIYRPRPACIALVGPSGCGKTTLIEAAVKHFLAGQRRPHSARLPKLWLIDPLRVISGMSVVGMWQRRVQAIVDHLRTRLRKRHKVHKTDHLYIDNVVALFRVGRSTQNSLTLADVLKPYLEKRAFTVVIEATPDAWHKAQQLDRAFTDLFEVLRVEPPPPAEALLMIARQRAALELEHGCRFATAALTALWELRQRRAGERALPGAVTDALTALAGRYRNAAVDRQAVFADYQASHKFRPQFFDPQQTLDDRELRDALDRRLVGQEAAKQALADTLHVVKARLGDPGRPLASLLFVGPTGVGKTEAAKTLAGLLFSDPRQLLRVDLNEYVDAGAVARLIGDAARPQGWLTGAVRRRKACVLLLDEIEKAHPSVHDLLLQLLDAGRLSDASGRVCDFRQCIVVMTSNLGAAEAGRQPGFAVPGRAGDQAYAYTRAVERFFRPEFLNRIDRQVVFTPLAADAAVGLVRLQLQRLLGRDGFTRRTVFLSVGDDALRQVAAAGFDPQLGGRALKRNLERSLTALSAEQLAVLPADHPLLLEVYLDDGVLRPQLTALRYAERQTTDLPTVADAELPQAFAALATELEALEDALNERVDRHPERRAALWDSKEQLRELQQAVADVCWDAEQWRQLPDIRGKSKLFRLKRRSRLSNAWRQSKDVYRDLAAQSEIGDFFIDRYASAAALSDRGAPFYLQQWLAQRMLRHVLAAQDRGGPDQVIITLAPYSADGTCAAALDFLHDQYRLLAGAQRSSSAARPHGQRFLLAEGYGLYSLLRHEAGLHLFLDPQRRSRLLRVGVTLLEAPGRDGDWPAQADLFGPAPPQRTPPGAILRVYQQRDSGRLISDLRSGLMTSGRLSYQDWQLLLLHTGQTAP